MPGLFRRAPDPCYSAAMNTTEAPEIAPGYPYRRRVFPAWQEMWDALSASSDFLDGRELAAEMAEKHGLQDTTLVGVLSRAASAGLLDTEQRPVEGTRGIRPRTFYKIKG